jgi:hypothetical protein
MFKRDKRYSKMMITLVSDDMYKELCALSKHSKVSVAELVRCALVQLLMSGGRPT